ncbi:CAP domain-containing protein [Bacteroidota bacterium]
MNKRFLVAFLLLLPIALIISSCKKTEDKEDIPEEEVPVLTTRDQAIQNYIDDYIGSECPDPGWTGTTTGCNAGSVSQAANNKTVKRVNYFRHLVGLPADVVLNPNQSQMCQEAALMFKANNNLSHNPPASWQCWTQAGKDAAGGSNIGWGSYEGPNAIHASNAVTGYIEDPGLGNEPVGHRAWILYPQLSAIGHGSTSSTNCLMWKDNLNGNPSPMPDFVAYPPKGFIPAPLVFNRWSFSIPNANFSGATVTIKDASNNNVSLSVIHRAAPGGAPDARIVWKPNNIITNSAVDEVYTVTIGGITGASSSTYTYDVTILPTNSLTKSKTLYEQEKPADALIEIK